MSDWIRPPWEGGYEKWLDDQGWLPPWGALSLKMRKELRAFLMPVEIDRLIQAGGSPDAVHAWPGAGKFAYVGIERAKQAIAKAEHEARGVQDGGFEELCARMKREANIARDVCALRQWQKQTPNPEGPGFLADDVWSSTERPEKETVVRLKYAGVDIHVNPDQIALGGSDSDEYFFTCYAEYRALLYLGTFHVDVDVDDPEDRVKLPEPWPEEIQPKLEILHGGEKPIVRRRRETFFLARALCSPANPNRNEYAPDRNHGPETVPMKLRARIIALLGGDKDKVGRDLVERGFRWPEGIKIKVSKP